VTSLWTRPLFVAVRSQSRLSIFSYHPHISLDFTRADALAGWRWQDEAVLDVDGAIGEPAIEAFNGKVYAVWLSGTLPFECETHHTLVMSERSDDGTWSEPRLVASENEDPALCGRPNCVLDKSTLPWRPQQGAWSGYCPLPTTNDPSAVFAWTSHTAPDLTVRRTGDAEELFLVRTDTEGKLDVLVYDEPFWTERPDLNLRTSDRASRLSPTPCKFNGTTPTYCEISDDDCDNNATCCKPDSLVMRLSSTSGWAQDLATDSKPSIAWRPHTLRQQGVGEGALLLLHGNAQPLTRLKCEDPELHRCASNQSQYCMDRFARESIVGDSGTPHLTHLPVRPEVRTREEARSGAFLLTQDHVRATTTYKQVDSDFYRDPPGTALHYDPAFTNIHAAMILSRPAIDNGMPALYFFPYADGVTEAVMTSDNDFELMDACMCHGLNECDTLIKLRKDRGGDDDGDGEADNEDNCPLVFNPKPIGEEEQVDSDDDGIGDACDHRFSLMDCGPVECPSARAMCWKTDEEINLQCTENRGAEKVPPDGDAIRGEFKCHLKPCAPAELPQSYCVERR